MMLQLWREMEDHGGLFLAIFLAIILPMICVGRADWNVAGLRLYLSHSIMQVTLVDFAFVLSFVTVWIHRDARRNGLTYWWILPTYPFMPTVGILAYFLYRQAALRRARR
jgi:hypothetical protein